MSTTNLLDMNVGTHEKKEVSELNNELFNAAKRVIEGGCGENEKGKAKNRCWHIGWGGVGDFIDYLEQNYEIAKKP